ncbi:CHASE2 domain-containing protein [Phormidium sp. CCY1219]|uniref:CHASE2 domain-containing protein n=1 Tax=Phormidium sp. CCY1219 TaxID=2886104 RepID=UPI002D1E8DC8|nr:CHASE2 domain-containing protein [Phormidium sp. CCY1219]MEB3829439.1 CHASE2 domain-containing protein [Phormidium sp. CCY1219]
MVKVVKLAVEGELESGYAVELVDIREDGKPTSIEGGVIGQLPPAIEIYRDYLAWKERYEQLCNLHQQSFRGLRKRNSAVKLPTEISQRSRSECRRECQAAANRLKANFKEWLESREFRKVLDKVQIHLNPQDNIRVLIQTEDLNLWKFPWSEWNLFENYHRGEVCFSPSEFRGIEEPLATRRRKDVNILAVFGDSSGINLDKDEKTIKGLRSVGAEPQPMKEPGVKQFRDRLREKQWDILFFSGHGNSEDREEKIRLNGEEWVTPERMKSDLKEAIGNGLKIAILNSCLGLGFARQVVSEFHLPIAIAMREKVPNEFAQTFLEYVLIEYAQKGEPLYVAVRKARERLADDWRDRLPGVEWLPVTCMNPATRPPTWADLHRPVALREVAFASLLCTTLVMVARFMGLLQPLELAAFDHLMRMRPDEGPDDRFSIVTITDEDDFPVTDKTLAQALENLIQHQPLAIGLDILRPEDQPPGSEALTAQFHKNKELIVGICQYEDSTNKKITHGHPPHPANHENYVAFNNIIEDNDGFVRRLLLARTAREENQSKCPVSYSLSAYLALTYLEKYLETEEGSMFGHLKTEEGLLKIGETSEGNLMIGDVVFKLEKGKGFYYKIDDSGHQVLSNYRNRKQFAYEIPLKQVVKGNIDPDKIQNRIVLIGVMDREKLATPFGNRSTQKMSGVVVHAQMASQIIDTVLKKRHLPWFWPLWGDVVWIVFWSFVAGLLIRYYRSPLQQRLGIIVTIGVLYGVCSFVFSTMAGCLPLVPSALSLVATGVILEGYINSQFRGQKSAKVLFLGKYLGSDNHGS